MGLVHRRQVAELNWAKFDRLPSEDIWQLHKEKVWQMFLNYYFQIPGTVIAPCVNCVGFVLLRWRGMVLISFSKDLSPIFSLRLQMALSLCPQSLIHFRLACPIMRRL